MMEAAPDYRTGDDTDTDCSLYGGGGGALCADPAHCNLKHSLHHMLVFVVVLQQKTRSKEINPECNRVKLFLPERKQSISSDSLMFDAAPIYPPLPPHK